VSYDGTEFGTECDRDFLIDTAELRRWHKLLKPIREQIVQIGDAEFRVILHPLMPLRGFALVRREHGR